MLEDAINQPAEPPSTKTSTLGTSFNILCIVVGTGLFSLPFGFSQTGWIGAPFLVVMSCVACYTASVLVACFDLAAAQGSDNLSALLPEGASGGPPPPKPKTYGDIGYAAFGPCGRWFVTVQQHLTLFLVATVYHLLPALNLVQLLPHVQWLTQPVAVALVAALVWPHCFLRTLSEVVWISYVNIAISVAFLAAVLFATADNPCVAPARPPSSPPHPQLRVLPLSSLTPPLPPTSRRTPSAPPSERLTDPPCPLAAQAHLAALAHAGRARRLVARRRLLLVRLRLRTPPAPPSPPPRGHVPAECTCARAARRLRAFTPCCRRFARTCAAHKATG